jgi:hypothetical protein
MFLLGLDLDQNRKKIILELKSAPLDSLTLTKNEN